MNAAKILEELGLNILDIIEKGKNQGLHVAQIEKAMEIVAGQIFDEKSKGDNSFGSVPRRIYHEARKIKSKHYQLASVTIKDLRRENMSLRAQRGIIIGISLIIIVGLLCYRIVEFF